jgi:glycosyltransferase involved in cell wall biosynthesis
MRDKFTSVSLCNDLENLHEAIKLHASHADIFHVHNEPSWFVTMIKEVCNKPVLLDIHDTYLTRTTQEELEKANNNENKVTRYTVDEHTNFQLADGLNFVSNYVRDDVCKEYNLTQPYAVIPSYVPSGLFRYRCYEWQGGLVYQGKVSLEKENTNSNYGFKYCQYQGLAEEAKSLGLDFHIYTIRTDKDFHATFDDVAFVHQPCSFMDVLKNLTKHDWGLVGNTFPTTQWAKTSSNKMFEYIAAAVPVVAMNAKWSEEFVSEHEVGLSVESLPELTERWREHRDIRKKLITNRQRFSMESHLGEIEQLYKDTIDAAGSC